MMFRLKNHDPNPYNLGYKLEELLMRNFCNMGLFKTVLHENDIRKKWGWNLSSIDFWLETESYIILVQTKWRKTRRKETKGVNNFLRSLTVAKQIANKKITFCLWVARREPFEDLISILETNNVYCISSYDSIDKLVSKTIEFIESKVIH